MNEEIYRLHEYFKCHQWLAFAVPYNAGNGETRNNAYRFCNGCGMLEWYNTIFDWYDWTDCPEIAEDAYWKKIQEQAALAGVDLSKMKRPL